MNSSGHLISSLIKSALRILGCIAFAILYNYEYVVYGVNIFLSSFVLAEILGIAEELLDKR